MGRFLSCSCGGVCQPQHGAGDTASSGRAQHGGQWRICVLQHWTVQQVSATCADLTEKHTKAFRNLLHILISLYGSHCCSYNEESKHTRAQNRVFLLVYVLYLAVLTVRGVLLTTAHGLASRDGWEGATIRIRYSAQHEPLYQGWGTFENEGQIKRMSCCGSHDKERSYN